MPHFLKKVLLMAAVLALPGLAEAQASLNSEVEAKVRSAFSDAPDMVLVAKCESGFRQFAADGSVLRGGADKRYLGIFQISIAHLENATKAGADLMTVDGNLAYARSMYDAQGIAPWKECAPPKLPPEGTAPARDALTLNLQFGMRNEEVLKLQRLLNAAGFPVALSGSGAPGQETDYFGGMTKEAVRRFQCDRKIACEGDERSTGFGRVGPATRNALNQGSRQ